MLQRDDGHRLSDVAGQVFEVGGGRISVTDNWRHGHGVDRGDRWEPAEIGPVVRDLLAKTEPVKVIGAR